MLPVILLSAVCAAQSVREYGDWSYQPYARPQFGLSTWTSGGTTRSATSLGAQVGIRFWEQKKRRPRIEGISRASGSYLLSNGADGLDVRVGAFAGPAWKKLRVQTGPDVYWNRYTWGNVTLDPTTGLAWPVQASTRLKGISLLAGLQPSFFLSSERDSVDWSEESLPGFGDEFTYFGAVGVSLGSLRFNVSLTQTITAYGSDRSLGLGVRL